MNNIQGKASSLFRVGQGLGVDMTNVLEREILLPICPKCEKVANVTGVELRKNKSGSYYYRVYRHLDHRKRSGYAKCYVKIEMS